jgi:hypothetical protein
VFKLIEEMNRRKIPVTLVNPFDYDNFVTTHSRQLHQPVVIMPNTTRQNSDAKLA